MIPRWMRPRWLVVEAYRQTEIPIERARWTRAGAERAARRAAARTARLRLERVSLDYRVAERAS